MKLAKFESLKNAKQQIDKLANEKATLQTELAQWKEDYSQKESQLLSLQASLENNDMASQLAEAQSQASKFQSQVTSLEQQVEAHQGKIAELTSEFGRSPK